MSFGVSSFMNRSIVGVYRTYVRHVSGDHWLTGTRFHWLVVWASDLS